jgi:hypothetical protein
MRYEMISGYSVRFYARSVVKQYTSIICGTRGVTGEKNSEIVKSN